MHFRTVQRQTSSSGWSLSWFQTSTTPNTTTNNKSAPTTADSSPTSTPSDWDLLDFVCCELMMVVTSYQFFMSMYRYCKNHRFFQIQNRVSSRLTCVHCCRDVSSTTTKNRKKKLIISQTGWQLTTIQFFLTPTQHTSTLSDISLKPNLKVRYITSSPSVSSQFLA